MNDIQLLSPPHADEQSIAGSSIQQQPTATSLVEAAIAYAANGLSVIPTNQEKEANASWTKYQSEIPDNATLRSWTSRFQGVAIISGKLSGIEVVDIDEKKNVDAVSLMERFTELANLAQPGLLNRLVIQKTRNNGYHVIYRCNVIGKYIRLAARPASSKELLRNEKAKSATLIETRGEGEYFVCDPTPGYTVIQNSLLDIPTISPEERDILFGCARSMNSYFSKDKIEPGKSKGTPGRNRPGDQFNERGLVKDLLIAAGWKLIKENDEQEYWRRPGKENGISATFNKKMQLFYVFSSNADPFEPLKAYTKFAVYSLLKHDGKFDEAAKALVAEGFGSPENSATNLAKTEEFLTERYLFRYNVITQRTEVCPKESQEFSVIEDYDFNSIFRELHCNSLPINFDALHHLIESDFADSVDLFCDYFSGLPQWDGQEDHIGKLAATLRLKHAEEAGSFDECLKRFLIGQVACATGNAVNQTAIILVGPQGIGKSTWLNRLIPPALSSYRFVGTINPDNKDTLAYLSEKMLINLDELETLKKNDIGSLKTIMTLDHITVRRPYGRYSGNLKRRASFVGSINNTDFLNDATGSRRFLVFEVDAFDLHATVDLDKVYSQAKALLEDGYRWWFDQAEIEKINESNKRYLRRTHEHELLNQYFKHGVQQEVLSEWLTASGVARKLLDVHRSFHIDDKSVRNLGVALTAEGYPSINSNGSKKYFIMLDPLIARSQSQGG